ncbi:MAG: hypothetical protein Q7S78_00195 [Candidatus Azambacteria bacterium]|nr:hypothetical protein [Candidatus Azambacteria bacterium]
MKNLRFYFNKKLDALMVEEFLKVSGGGIDFGQNIFKIHPQLKSVKLLNFQQRKKTINAYFNNYYRTHKAVMRCRIKNIRDAWPKHEREFVAITEDFFGSFRFPRGKYIAYASILNCNPRFLDLKTFQFFYEKPLADAIYTIAHELLHFIFYDFIEKKLKKEVKHLSEDQLWDLSEIFNVVVLGSPRYCRIINQKFVIPYPDHRRYISQFEKAYKNSKNAKEFIRRGITIISAKK